MDATERLRLQDPGVRHAARRGTWTLVPDVTLMRRQRVHYLYAPRTAELSIHRSLTEALAQALESGARKIDVLQIDRSTRTAWVRFRLTKPPSEKSNV